MPSTFAASGTRNTFLEMFCKLGLASTAQQLMHMHAGAVKTFPDFEHRPFTSICGVKFLAPMSPTRLGPCAALELSGGGFETAADCYLRAAIADPRSSAAVCGLLRLCRRKDADGNRGSTWEDRVQLLNQTIAARVGGGAARCARAAASECLLGAPPKAPSPPASEPAKRPDSAAARSGPTDAAARPPSSPKPSAAAESDFDAEVRRLTAEGRVLVQNGRVEQAHPLLQRAVTIDVRYGESQLWLGLCEVRLGQREVSDRD